MAGGVMMAFPATNLEQLLNQIGQAPAENERVSLDEIVEAVGKRAFGPLLLGPVIN